MSRLTDEQILAARDYGRKTGDYAEEAIATEVLESRAALAIITEDRLTEIITDSIDLDWTPRDAAKAIMRAMKGGNT
jgi:hypothetical protein